MPRATISIITFLMLTLVKVEDSSAQLSPSMFAGMPTAFYQFTGSYGDCNRAGRMRELLNDENISGNYSVGTGVCTIIVWPGTFNGSGTIWESP